MRRHNNENEDRQAVSPGSGDVTCLGKAGEVGGEKENGCSVPAGTVEARPVLHPVLPCPGDPHGDLADNGLPVLSLPPLWFTSPGI